MIKPDATSSRPAPEPSWNPLQCRGTDLPLNLTVMVKVLAMVLLLVNHVRILPDPWLPFVPGLDLLPPLLFQRTLQTVFVLSAIAIVFNRQVRLSSLVLGATMLLAVVSSKAYYGNNKTFCGLMLFLAGLYQPGGPNFIRWQLAITYFGAGLNKALDGDWHSGVFFENWAVTRLRQPWYIALDSHLPPLVLGRFMCWTTIITELATVPCLLIPSLQYWAILANIFFQSSLLLFTGTTFTLFFYSMTAASLAFFSWPSAPVPVYYDPDRKMTQRIKSFFSAWDMDGLFHWLPQRYGQQPLVVQVGDKVYSGFRALRMMILLNPITYFAIAGSIAALGDLPGPAVLYRRLIVSVSLLLLMPPLAWIADRLAGATRLPESVGSPGSADVHTAGAGKK
ncbi:MAG TPA: HTTM domain-containing protein [Bryobacteraceae bacterium]|nr:HTTM domain-containing protein [Bryobacteraceae bacterium]